MKSFLLYPRGGPWPPQSSSSPTTGYNSALGFQSGSQCSTRLTPSWEKKNCTGQQPPGKQASSACPFSVSRDWKAFTAFECFSTQPCLPDGAFWGGLSRDWCPSMINWIYLLWVPSWQFPPPSTNCSSCTPQCLCISHHPFFCHPRSSQDDNQCFNILNPYCAAQELCYCSSGTGTLNLWLLFSLPRCPSG